MNLWHKLNYKLSRGDGTQLWDVYWVWWHTRAKAKAMRVSPRYKEIEETLRLPDGNYRFDSDLMGEQYDIFWTVNRRSLYWYVHHFLNDHGPRHQLRMYRHLRQRSVRGWSEADSWSASYSIAAYIEGIINHLKLNIHGYPNGLTPEEWQIKLQEIVEGMRAAQQLGEHWERNQEYEDLMSTFNRGMDTLKEHWFDLWD